MIRKFFLKSLFVISLLVSSPAFAGIHCDNVDDSVGLGYVFDYAVGVDWSWCVYMYIDDAATDEEISVGVIGDGSNTILQISVQPGSQCGAGTTLEPMAFLRDENGNENFSTPICSGTSMTPGKWHQVCLTFDDSGDDHFLYMDGVQVGSDTGETWGGAWNSTDNVEVTVCARNGTSSPGAFWDGGVSDFSAWDGYLLTADDVAQIYNAKLRRIVCQIAPANLDVYLPLDDVEDGGDWDGIVPRSECGNYSVSGGQGDNGANNTGLDGDNSEPIGYPPQ